MYLIDDSILLVSCDNSHFEWEWFLPTHSLPARSTNCSLTWSPHSPDDSEERWQLLFLEHDFWKVEQEDDLKVRQTWDTDLGDVVRDPIMCAWQSQRRRTIWWHLDRVCISACKLIKAISMHGLATTGVDSFDWTGVMVLLRLLTELAADTQPLEGAWLTRTVTMRWDLLLWSWISVRPTALWRIPRWTRDTNSSLVRTGLKLMCKSIALFTMPYR